MLAPLMALINNVIEQRTDPFKIDTAMQRPEFQRSSGIGVYAGVLYFTVVASVLSNILLVVKFNGDSDDSWYDTSNNMEVVVVIVGTI